MEIMKKYLLIYFSIIFLLLLNFQNVFAISCSKLNDTTFCDDGSTYTQLNDTLYGNNGSTYTQLNDTFYGNDGSTYTRLNNTIYENNGSTYTILNDTVFGSDGSTYTQYGNTIYGNNPSYKTTPTPTTPTTHTCPINSYYDGISSCKCNYGYVTGSYGQCESTITVCSETMGLMSQYNTLSNICECMHGYKFSGGRCIYNQTLCHNQFGYNSSYDYSSDQCKCNSGYINGVSGQCESIVSYCSGQLGIMSRYNSLSKKCECIAGYELNGSNCVYKTINYPALNTYKNKQNQTNPNDWVEVTTPVQKYTPDVLPVDSNAMTTTTNNTNKQSFWSNVIRYLNPFSWFKK